MRCGELTELWLAGECLLSVPVFEDRYTLSQGQFCNTPFLGQLGGLADVGVMPT